MDSDTGNSLQDQQEVIDLMTDASGEKEPPVHLANLVEHRRAFTTQAYMLIFIREAEIDQILTTPVSEDIPRWLREQFSQENDLVREMKHELESHYESEPVYVITPEIMSHFAQNGLNGVNYLSSVGSLEFLEQPEYRHKFYLPRQGSKVLTLLTKIAEKTQTEVNELSAWRFCFNQPHDTAPTFTLTALSLFDKLFRRRSYDPEIFFVRLKTEDEMKLSTPAKLNHLFDH